MVFLFGTDRPALGYGLDKKHDCTAEDMPSQPKASHQSILPDQPKTVLISKKILRIKDQEKIKKIRPSRDDRREVHKE
jgi:hypothetical protein